MNSPTVWADGFVPHKKSSNEVKAFEEQPGRRAQLVKAIRKTLVDHYVGAATIMKAGGYAKAAALIRLSMPTKKRIQSGDVAEVLAAEFLHAETGFKVPIKKLRWKSDRDTPLHGDDLIGIGQVRRSIRILKGECKSRVRFNPSHAKEAVKQLDKDGCRPNPSTLAYITKRLYELGRDDEARVFQDLITKGLSLKKVEHMLFVLSQNTPIPALSGLPEPTRKSVRKRWAAVVVVDEHAALIREVFEQG